MRIRISHGNIQVIKPLFIYHDLHKTCRARVTTYTLQIVSIKNTAVCVCTIHAIKTVHRDFDDYNVKEINQNIVMCTESFITSLNEKTAPLIRVSILRKLHD